MDAVTDAESIHLTILHSQNWPTWDVALFLDFNKEGKREVHIAFLQMTTEIHHNIHAEGFNQVKDAIPESGNGEGLSVHYH